MLTGVLQCAPMLKEYSWWQALKDILSRGEGSVGGDIPSQEEVNELISRTKDEVIMFGEMDEENDRRYGGRPRLMTAEEVPSWVTEEDEVEEV